MQSWSRDAFLENGPRSRYPDVFCFDATRIRLRDVENDFIHASSVQLPGEAIRYILTQAPLKITVVHFWRMVWQEKPAVIAILCQPRRDEERFLPMIGQEYRFGDFKVTRSIELQSNERWTITTCSLALSQGQDEEDSDDIDSIDVRCAIWNEWVHDDELPPPSKMIAFVQELHVQYDQVQSAGQQDEERRQGLVFVCASGAFRSGLVAACSALLRAFSQELFAPDQIVRVVKALRQARHRTIDRFSQFVYLHWLICEATCETMAEDEKEEEKNRIVRAVERARKTYVQVLRDEKLAALRNV